MRTSSVLLLLLLHGPLAAQDVDYERDIRPMLADKCVSCHGALRQEAGLRVDHGQLLRQGGDDGSVIDLQDVSASRLMQRVSSTDASDRMPPEDEGAPLTSDQLLTLSQWLAGGAVSPEEEPIPLGPDEHWAWQVPRRALPPHEKRAADRDDGSYNPVDAFVFAKHKAHGIEALPLADRRTRLRRLYFDLIGLPPSGEQQREFLEDQSADAWHRLVSKLLDSPAYGERWARHWMDVWRYSDWDGYKDQVRGSQRHIWRWRDWIIDALNEGKGYDQMILEMLAGDELAPEDPDVLRATGFLVRNFHNSNRNIWLDATVEHTAKAFLATTINCARCHDHKYDPISQREYYAFRAIFEPHQARTERVKGQPNILQDGLVRAYDAQPDEPTYLFVGGNEKTPDKEHPVEPATPSIVDVPFEITPVELPKVAAFPSLREFVEREDLSTAEEKLKKARQAFSGLVESVDEKADEASIEFKLAKQAVAFAVGEMAALKARWQADKARFGGEKPSPSLDVLRWSAATLEHAAQVENAKLTLLQRQKAVQQFENSDENVTPERKAAIDKAQKDLEATQKQLSALVNKAGDGMTYTSVGPAYPAVSTGRRLTLARWITNAQNPLTARVAINYIWLHHFGQPLVDNVFDFGLRSPEPTHRALLDWLAVELMENNWSMKHIHRLITTSKTYQLASFSPEDAALMSKNQRLDPDNRWLWRANTRRLEAEVIRDSLLQVASNLDIELGGPDIDYQKGEVIPRRSIYFRHAYEKQMTMLVVFDAAGPTECYRRSPSVVPGQALALANGPLAFDQARRLAKQLRERAAQQTGPSEAVKERTFIRNAFELLLARECTDEELRVCEEFLRSQADLLENGDSLTELPGKSTGLTAPATDAAQRARESLVHTLLNHNDFVTIR